MGITVRHDPDFATVAKTAQSVGSGTRSQQQREFLAKMAIQQQSVDNQRLGIYSSLQNSREGRGLQSDMLDRQLHSKERNWNAVINGQFDRQEMSIGANRELQDEAHQNRLEVMDKRQQNAMEQLEARDRLDREKTTWEYSEQQKKKKAKIDEGRAAMRQQFASGQITQGELEQFDQQFDALEYSIMPVRKYNNEPSPEEIMQQRTFIDKDTGDKLYIEPNGRIKNLSAEQRDSEVKAKKAESDFAAKQQKTKLDFETEQQKMKIEFYKMALAADVPITIEQADKLYREKILGETDGDESEQPMTEMQSDNLDGIWEETLKTLEDDSAGRATEAQMYDAKDKFVAAAVEKGIDPKTAEQDFMKKWEIEGLLLV